MTARLTRRLGAVVGAAALAGSLASCASVVGISDPPTATVGGAVSSSRAQAIAAEVVDTAQKAAATPGAEGDALRDSAFTGDALTAAKADAKLAGTLSQDQKEALTLTSADPVVLAVSNGLSYPRSMVVQTTRAKSGLPVLSLLVTPDVRTPFKIAASAPMLPATEVPAFDQVTQGAPSLGDDAAGLAVEPEQLVGAYARRSPTRRRRPPTTDRSPTTPSPTRSRQRPRTRPTRSPASVRSPSSTWPRTSRGASASPETGAPWHSPCWSARTLSSTRRPAPSTSRSRSRR
jgi:hypothetical protein